MIGQTWTTAEKLINEILSLAVQLNRQLVQESALLKAKAGPAALDSSTALKSQLVGRLEGLNQHFRQLLQTENLPPDQVGAEQYFQRAAQAGLPTAEAVANWRQIRLICAECKVLNEQNGASIELLNQHTKRSLDILKGKTSVAGTYSRDGVSKSDALPNILTLYL